MVFAVHWHESAMDLHVFPQRTDAFELWCWRRLLRVPWTARRSNQSVPRKSTLNIHWKDWCWSWSSNTLATWCEELTHEKRPWYWERLKAEEKGTTEDEMVGWHHQLNGHEFEQAPGDGEGQGSLVCCSPWGHKESDVTEWLNSNTSKSLQTGWDPVSVPCPSSGGQHLHKVWVGLVPPRGSGRGLFHAPLLALGIAAFFGLPGL